MKKQRSKMRFKGHARVPELQDYVYRAVIYNGNNRKTPMCGTISAFNQHEAETEVAALIKTNNSTRSNDYVIRPEYLKHCMCYFDRLCEHCIFEK
jgi:hypothetical protein